MVEKASLLSHPLTVIRCAPIDRTGLTSTVFDEVTGKQCAVDINLQSAELQVCRRSSLDLDGRLASGAGEGSAVPKEITEAAHRKSVAPYSRCQFKKYAAAVAAQQSGAV